MRRINHVSIQSQLNSSNKPFFSFVFPFVIVFFFFALNSTTLRNIAALSNLQLIFTPLPNVKCNQFHWHFLRLYFTLIAFGSVRKFAILSIIAFAQIRIARCLGGTHFHIHLDWHVFINSVWLSIRLIFLRFVHRKVATNSRSEWNHEAIHKSQK